MVDESSEAALSSYRTDEAPLEVSQVVGRLARIQQVLATVMKQNVHYGVIPGCPQPSLWKPGAEVLCLTFGIGTELTLTDLSTEDAVKYAAKITAISPAGRRLHTGVGTCSSNEEKYRWRAAVCQEEFDETPPDRRRKRWKKGRGGKAYFVQQVRTEPADLDNTVAQMAAKRALVAVTRLSTSCSDVFAQDLEDLQDKMDLDHEAPAHGEPDLAPKRTAQPQGQGQEPAREPADEGARPTRPAATVPVEPTVPPGCISPAQVRRLFAIGRGKDKPPDRLKDWLIEEFGLQIDLIPKERFDEVQDALLSS